jgi:hypothetical protein
MAAAKSKANPAAGAAEESGGPAPIDVGRFACSTLIGDRGTGSLRGGLDGGYGKNPADERIGVARFAVSTIYPIWRGRIMTSMRRRCAM